MERIGWFFYYGLSFLNKRGTLNLPHKFISYSTQKRWAFLSLVKMQALFWYTSLRMLNLCGSKELAFFGAWLRATHFLFYREWNDILVHYCAHRLCNSLSRNYHFFVLAFYSPVSNRRNYHICCDFSIAACVTENKHEEKSASGGVFPQEKGDWYIHYLSQPQEEQDENDEGELHKEM